MDPECTVVFDSNQLVEIKETPDPEPESFASSFNTFVDAEELMVLDVLCFDSSIPLRKRRKSRFRRSSNCRFVPIFLS